MSAMREQHVSGLDYLGTVTSLLQRIRNAHPTAGLYQAAEVQWWWRSPRPTDDLPQLFWFDGDEQPAAAVVATDFGDGSSAVFEATTLAAIVLPDASPDWTTHVVERGLSHAGACGLDAVDVEVDEADHLVRGLLAGRGFTRRGDGVVVGWLAAEDRPAVSPLADGYILTTRAATIRTGRPHHFGSRNGSQTEARLLQTSLYRPDLDLVVVDAGGDVGGYGLCWFDPTTATGVVEPMRTDDAHQRRGLARHVLTAGIDRLAAAGAERISIAWEPDNPASGHLYRSVGFEPVLATEILSGSTGRPAPDGRRRTPGGATAAGPPVVAGAPASPRAGPASARAPG
jgi:ribosomal protein S18 acetylase RimI-like enzyme